MKARIVNRTKQLWFRVRWFTMSDRERYAYLWHVTKSNLQASLR